MKQLCHNVENYLILWDRKNGRYKKKIIESLTIKKNNTLTDGYIPTSGKPSKNL